MISVWGDAWGSSWGAIASGEVEDQVKRGSGGNNQSSRRLTEAEKERQRAAIRKLLSEQHEAAKKALEVSTKEAPKETKKRVRRLAKRAKTLLETDFEPTPKMVKLAEYQPINFEQLERQIYQLARLIQMQEEEDLLLLLSY